MSNQAVAYTSTQNAYEYPARSEAPVLMHHWVDTVPVASYWHRDAVKATLQLAALPHNWDTYGSLPPTAIAIKGAIALLAHIAKLGFDDLPSPNVVPVPGGGVQFEWLVDTRELELEIRPDGSVDFLKSQAGEPIEEGQVSFGGRAQLQSLLSWLAALAL